MPRAAVLQEFDAPFVIQSDVEWAAPTAHRVIVRTTASAFCSTDLMSIHGINGKRPPTILGHSAVGVIEELGDDVTGFSVGQRVVVPGTPECGRCFYCGIGRPDQCSEIFDLPDGWPRLAKDSRGNVLEIAGSMGSYAELMNLSANHIWAFENDLPDEVPAMYGCGLLTGWGAVVTTAEVQQGESVVVVGAGHLGLWAVQAAKVAGAGPIIVVEPLAHRRETAGALGATHVVDPSSEDAVDVVRGLTGGRGADHVIETAGPVEAASLALSLSRRAGTVVLTGYAGEGSTLQLDQLDAGPRGRRVLGCQNGNVRMSRDIPRVTRLIERGEIVWEPIVTRSYRLDEINEARERSESRVDLTGIILPQQ